MYFVPESSRKKYSRIWEKRTNFKSIRLNAMWQIDEHCRSKWLSAQCLRTNSCMFYACRDWTRFNIKIIVEDLPPILVDRSQSEIRVSLKIEAKSSKGKTPICDEPMTIFSCKYQNTKFLLGKENVIVFEFVKNVLNISRIIFPTWRPMSFSLYCSCFYSGIAKAGKGKRHVTKNTQPQQQ